MSRAQLVANRLLALKGVPAALTHTDPLTGAVQQRSGSVVIIGTVKTALQGELSIQVGDDHLLGTAALEAKKGDRISYAGKSRVVAYVDPIYEGATIAAAYIYARSG